MTVQDGEEAAVPAGVEAGGEAAAGPGEPASVDADAGDGESEPEPDSAESDSDEGFRQQVTNIFHGQVLVGEGGTVGFAVDQEVRRETGRVSESEIDAIRDLYLRTPSYEEALSRLRRLHLVILVGAEDSGRAAASLILAAQLRAAGTRIMRLPPTRSLADLARQDFKAGRCYVLHDWIAGASARSPLARFDAQQLAQKLAAAEAFLVITASAAFRAVRATLEHEVRWTAPEPASLFAYCFARVDRLVGVERDLETLRDCAVRLGSPRRVVALATRLCDGAEEALRSAEDTDQQEIAAWFEKSPNRRAVRAATVLALACRTGDESADAPGVTQRGFEELFSALERAEARFWGEKPPDEAPLPDDLEVFPQTRHNLMAETGLDRFTVKPPEAAVVGVEHMPGFRTRRQRDLFHDGLTRKCGNELWSPVRAWSSGVVSKPDVSDAHLAVSYGVGRLARYATKEVREAYLEQWAAGLMDERFCAVFALWSMAAADDLAPVALSKARDWVWGRGQERAIVAAIAFGGALGKRYPSEAMWWLWKLALRGQRISRVACVAIGNLLAIDATSDDPSVARYLAKRAESVLRPGTPTQERRAVLRVVLDILAVPGTDPDVPGVLRVLRESAAAGKPLGRLWAAVLRSTPHRAEGIESLRATLAALAGTSDGTAVAARLGRQILPVLSAPQRRQVELGLRRPVSEEDRRVAHAVVLAFLDFSSPAASEQPPTAMERTPHR